MLNSNMCFVGWLNDWCIFLEHDYALSFGMGICILLFLNYRNHYNDFFCMANLLRKGQTYIFHHSLLIFNQEILCSSNPAAHSFVSDEEKTYLRKELVNLYATKDLPPTPWKAILSSRSVAALLVGSFLADWTYYVLETDLPKYMNDVLHVSVEENGVYSSIPSAAFVPVALLSSYWCDWLISSGRLNITQTRKLFVILCKFLAINLLHTNFSIFHFCSIKM